MGSLSVRRCVSFVRPMLGVAAFGLVLVVTTSSAYAQPMAAVPLTPGFQHLVDAAPEIVGVPLEPERSGDLSGSTIVRTTTGLLYWQIGVLPSWTDGHNRVTIDDNDQLKQWIGEGLSPPAPPAPASLPVAVESRSTGRVACIEGKESGGGNVSNSQGSGAGGVMQYMPGTFARGAAEMGHPEWSLWVPWQARAVAAHDLEMGRRSQWTVGGC